MSEYDKQMEESKETCMTTCNLKCKSETADKKDSCVHLCYNQCAASIALEKQSSQLSYRPLILQQTENVEVPAPKMNSIDRNYMKDSYYNRYPS